MRKIALTGLGGVVALNGLLGYAGKQLADMMRMRLIVESCEARPEPAMRQQLPSRPSK